MLTLVEKRLIGRYLRTDYTGVRNLRFGADHAVHMTIEKCPGTGRPGRVFAGWDTELLRDAQRRL